MIARLAGLFTTCMLTTGAAIVPVLEITPARELQAASRLVRDGDLQADRNKLLDARERLERLVHQKALPALQRALDRRGDFWWVSRVAMPQARRPVITTPEPAAPRAPGAFIRLRMPPVVAEWAEWAAAVWSTVVAIVQSLPTTSAAAAVPAQ